MLPIVVGAIMVVIVLGMMAVRRVRRVRHTSLRRGSHRQHSRSELLREAHHYVENHVLDRFLGDNDR